MNNMETRAQEIARLQLEITERQMRVQYLTLGDPQVMVMQLVSPLDGATSFPPFTRNK
jgi:hypothetical protein